MKTPNPVTINEPRHEVFIKGREVKLSPIEYQILLLLRNRNVTLNRDQIADEVETFGSDSRTIDQHVSRLRRKIGAQLIATISKQGYRWDGNK